MNGTLASAKPLKNDGRLEMNRPPVVAVCGVTYSSNLGDGVIAECIRGAVSELCPDVEVRLIDVAGRTGFGQDNGRRRLAAINRLRALPSWLRRIGVASALIVSLAGRRRRTIDEKLRGCNLVIIGGGQLLADVDLNFPIKIGLLARRARLAGACLYIYGCGVSKEWSAVGRRLFLGALRGPSTIGVGVRDTESYANLVRHMGKGGRSVSMALDPALLAPRYYRTLEPPTSDGPVGLGIADPTNLGYSGGASDFPSEARMIEFFVECTRLINAGGQRVRLFTNGAYEDESFLKLVAAAAERKGLSFDVAKSPIIPGDLIGNICGLGALIAHRLHASIIAYAYGIPSIGLGWDAKVSSFYELSNRSEFFLSVREASPERVVALLREVTHQGIAEVERVALCTQALSGVKHVLSVAGMGDLAGHGSARHAQASVIAGEE